MPPRTLHAAAAAIRDGSLTPATLLEECYARIDRYEPHVKAWVSVDREGARADAERLTAELRAGHDRGPLHGIPIGVKDIFDVAGWPTAAGFAPWSGAIARRDATAVAKLRQAGAIILGKTVTTAFACFDPAETRNPWDLTRTPGGSSSGSAAAVACGMCLAALGTQTGGSVCRPASYCGVCGLKPSFGRVSVDGVVPLAPSLDHVGVIAGCVTDLALVLQAIAGPDPRDPHSRPFGPEADVIPPPPVAPPGRAFRPGGLFDEMVEPVMREAFDRLAAVPRKRAVLPAGFDNVLVTHRRIITVEAADAHGDVCRRHGDGFPPKFRALIEEGWATPAVDYRRARQHQAELSAAAAAWLARPGDYLVMPATPGPPTGIETTGNPAFNAPWSCTGLPSVSLPFARTADGLPLALQLVARPGAEYELLATAAWWEDAIGFERRNPPLQ
jgi:Asp-tRNA(Asn)/Glu-tRNA(Gln) amidotransferase A subunit family amidase